MLSISNLPPFFFNMKILDRFHRDREVYTCSCCAWLNWHTVEPLYCGHLGDTNCYISLHNKLPRELCYEFVCGKNRL